MIKFTKEEINLCRQIAGKHRKAIEPRQYFYNDHLEKIQWIGERSLPKQAWAIPIWTIPDCLEFLREKYFFESMLLQLIWDGWNYVISKKPTQKEPSFQFSGITPLEACLKAVSAVLEEG
jgi:hypothetical protein